MGMEKRNNSKKRAQPYMQSCLVMGEDHHIVTLILENKYDDNEAFKGQFNREPR